MATTNLHITYRPVRIGWLIRNNSFEDLLWVVHNGTVLWGGISNPVISVGANESTIKEMIREYQPDVPLAVSEDDSITKIQRTYPWLMPDILRGRSVIGNRTGYFRKHTNYLDFFSLVDCLWDKEFRNKPHDYRSRFRIVNWNKDEALCRFKMRRICHGSNGGMW